MDANEEVRLTAKRDLSCDHVEIRELARNGGTTASCPARVSYVVEGCARVANYRCVEDSDFGPSCGYSCVRTTEPVEQRSN